MDPEIRVGIGKTTAFRLQMTDEGGVIQHSQQRLQSSQTYLDWSDQETNN